MPRYSSVMPQGAAHDERVHPTLILLVLSLAGLSYAILSSAVIPALPALQHDLHTSETGVTWLLTGFLLSASVATSIIGRLGDIYGKERLLVWTLVILAVGTLLAAVSQSLGMLIFARVIQGAGGGIFPLAFSIARDEFPRDRVAGSIGLISSILGVGGGAGLVIGALILEHLSWHWLFWLPLIVTVLAAVFTWRFIPESPVRAPGRINWLAATLMSIGICAILIAIAQTTVWGWGGVADVGRVRLRGGGVRGLGGGRGTQRQPARRHDDDAHPRRVDHQLGRIPARRGHVLLVHRLPPVRAATQEHRIWLRRLGRRL
ncbi:MAG: MFS transporter [Solirubrobacteraceae bacterium]